MPSYMPIADYALIGDSHTAALVSRSGSIDWACIPRLDSGACFARLLDRERGGHCSIEIPGEPVECTREYLEGTLVLATTLRAAQSTALLLDCLVLDQDRPTEESCVLRVVEGKRGAFGFRFQIAPRFDYGAVDPFLRQVGPDAFTAVGGDEGLLVWTDGGLEAHERRLEAAGTVRPGERVRLALTAIDPARLEDQDRVRWPAEELDRKLAATIEAWRRWSETANPGGADTQGAMRSALVLKALSYEPSGAIAAAATTSLPEAPGADRNWDYRYSWVRDSALAARSLVDLGYEAEADAFRRFIERSAAGNVEDLQIVYGLGGERRLPELALDHLEGYRGCGPVRIGNNASTQVQLDAYGHLLDQAWRWFERGHEPDDEYWRFLVDLVEAACERWPEPDAGLWEWRGEPRHFVHSKALCWVAVDRGLRLAERCMRKAPERRWARARDEIREAVEGEGYDEGRGVFVQAFGEPELDAALLRLPSVEFVGYEDERMVRTVDAVVDELEVDGLLRRHRADDGVAGEEGAFLACSFWLVECLARQGRLERARQAFDRAVATSNDLGLFSEQFDPEGEEMLGNFPQALTHFSHIEAALVLKESAAAEA